MKTNFAGWIKPGNHGTVIEAGIEYIIIYSWWERMILRPVKLIQKNLWLIGVSVHDPVFGECTPDFNCCCKGVGRKTFIRIGA